VNAYAAMDVFAFSSQSETQGMVLAEAMAARTPVVALDGPGVRDVLNDGNGHMLPAGAGEAEFAAALAEATDDRQALSKLADSARESVHDYGLGVCADRMLALYEKLVEEFADRPDADPGPWDRLVGRLEIEWNLFVEKTSALSAAVGETDTTRSHLD
jgi:1,2-diacylglycerol 3-alpha-glucosyltransferase